MARSYRGSMEFLVLGPLRVVGAKGPVEIRGAKERLLLAHLIAYAGRTVGSAELIDGLWGDDPPRSAGKALQNCVLRLRKALEPDRAGTPTVLITEGHGYRLSVESQRVDAERFARLLAAAEQVRAQERLRVLGGRTWTCGGVGPTPDRWSRPRSPPRPPDWRSCGWWPWRIGAQSSSNSGGTAPSSQSWSGT